MQPETAYQRGFVSEGTMAGLGEAISRAFEARKAELDKMTPEQKADLMKKREANAGKAQGVLGYSASTDSPEKVNGSQ